MQNQIGEMLKAHRKARQLTLMELADLCGIDHGNLSKLENGKQSLTNDTMRALAEAFKLTLPELFTFDGHAPKEKNVTIDARKKTNTGSINFRNVKSFKKLRDIPRGESVLIDGIKVASDPEDSGKQKWEVDNDVQLRFLGELIRELPDSQPANLLAIEVQDDAMSPRLFKTDRIVIDTGDITIPSTGGVYAIIVDNSKAIEVRRLFPKAGNGLMVVCDNDRYPTISLNDAEAACVAVVGRIKVNQSIAGF